MIRNIEKVIEKLRLETELENGTASYCRKGKWVTGWADVLNNDGKMISLRTYKASFRIVNKSGQEGDLKNYVIIIGSDKKVLWIGTDTDKKYFISCGNKIIKLNYEHKLLRLYPNVSSEDEYFIENDDEKNDALIAKYRKNLCWYKCASIEDAKKIFDEDKIGVIIDLDKHFEKGFFYKGFKWNYYWKEYYGYNYITIFIDIIVKDGLFYIEIENITYPFYGYVLFDINEIKILEARKVPEEGKCLK